MLAGFCLIGIIGLMIVFSMPAFDTLLNRFLTYSGDDTANGRTYLWAYALEMFHKKVYGDMDMEVLINMRRNEV